MDESRAASLLDALRAANQTKSDAFRLNASRFCLPCVSGAACRADAAEGLTLETLPLLPGYWRNSPRSLDIRSCGDRAQGTTPGCRGGAGEPCKDWLTGPLCTQCNVSRGRFYDADRFECSACGGGSAAGLLSPLYPVWMLRICESVPAASRSMLVGGPSSDST